MSIITPASLGKPSWPNRNVRAAFKWRGKRGKTKGWPPAAACSSWNEWARDVSSWGRAAYIHSSTAFRRHGRCWRISAVATRGESWDHSRRQQHSTQRASAVQCGHYGIARLGVRPLDSASAYKAHKHSQHYTAPTDTLDTAPLRSTAQHSTDRAHDGHTRSDAQSRLTLTLVLTRSSRTHRRTPHCAPTPRSVTAATLRVQRVSACRRQRSSSFERLPLRSRSSS